MQSKYDQGKKLFQHYQKLGEVSGGGTEDSYYAGILFTALLIAGEEELYHTLVDAEERDRRIDLTFPIPFDVGPSEPCGIVII